MESPLHTSVTFETRVLHSWNSSGKVGYGWRETGTFSPNVFRNCLMAKHFLVEWKDTGERRKK